MKIISSEDVLYKQGKYLVNYSARSDSINNINGVFVLIEIGKDLTINLLYQEFLKMFSKEINSYGLYYSVSINSISKLQGI